MNPDENPKLKIIIEQALIQISNGIAEARKSTNMHIELPVAVDFSFDKDGESFKFSIPMQSGSEETEDCHLRKFCIEMAAKNPDRLPLETRAQKVYEYIKGQAELLERPYAQRFTYEDGIPKPL